MIQYNITTKIDPALAEEWLEWQDQDESDGPTYIIQFISSSRIRYEAFDKKHAARLNQQTADRWGRHLVSYQSFMELVH